MHRSHIPVMHCHLGRGLSLVEMMVGIAIGLFIVASASLVVSTQLSDNRRLLLEVQVQQDLRATAEIITREIRRAGSRENAAIGVWQASVGVSSNPFSSISHADANREVRFDYERGTSLPLLGFRLDPARPVVQSFIGSGWQDLTDGNTLRVTAFTVAPVSVPAVISIIPCSKACSADPLDTACWPRFASRSYIIEITGQAASDANVRRTIRSEVRVRNDQIVLHASLPAGQACPE
jgi:type II secretory pathway component PulJ